MDLEEFKKKLKKYKLRDIIFTNHAEIQAIFREVNLEEVRRNILNPDKLIYVEEQDTNNLNKEKYACYFAYSKDFCHEYILTLNGKVIIVTIIVINRDWQKILERK